MTSTRTSTTGNFPWRMIYAYGGYTIVSWLVALAFLLVAVLLVNSLNTGIPESLGSAWFYLSSVGGWFAAGAAGYMAYWTAPIYVTHGHTRREAMRDSTITLAVLALLITVILIVSFLLEYALFGTLGWTRTIPESRLFASHLDIFGMINDFLPMILMLAAGGALVGALTYRYESWGWLSFVPALGLVFAYTILGENSLGLFRPELYTGATAVLMRWLSALLTAGIFLAVTWLAVRRVPIRS